MHNPERLNGTLHSSRQTVSPKLRTPDGGARGDRTGTARRLSRERERATNTDHDVFEDERALPRLDKRRRRDATATYDHQKVIRNHRGRPLAASMTTPAPCLEEDRPLSAEESRVGSEALACCPSKLRDHAYGDQAELAALVARCVRGETKRVAVALESTLAWRNAHEADTVRRMPSQTTRGRRTWRLGDRSPAA